MDKCRMETYAEVLQKRKENTMTNYDMDEIERQKNREKRSRGIVLGEKEELQTVEIEIDHKDLLKLALAAHDRDITLNKMCKIVLTSSLKDLEYRYEHQSKPQVLKEY